MKKITLSLLMLALFTCCLSSQASADAGSQFIVDAGNGDIEGVRSYLGNGGDVNIGYVNGGTALMAAAYEDRTGIVSYLISRGAQVDVKSKGSLGRTALMYAATSRWVDIPHFHEGEWMTVSSLRMSLESMKILIDTGANLNIKNTKGQTALVYLIENGPTSANHLKLDAVKLLLEAGADPNIADSYGDTALTIAYLKGMNDVAKLLKEYGAK